MWISEKIELNDWKMEERGDCDGWFVKMPPPWSKFEIDAGVWRLASWVGLRVPLLPVSIDLHAVVMVGVALLLSPIY